MARATWLAGLLALALSACAEPRSAHTNGNGGGVNPPDSLDRVLSRTFTVPAFKLESGVVLPELTLAYETYGRLAPDGKNAILVTHGFTSNHHAAGKYAVTDQVAGWWDGLIGSGKALDTDRYFVVSSNMLGSSFGSTAPASQNPKTGKPYGPDFPDITLRDIVGAQKTLLEGLGVQHLVAVAGPSYGGYQTFQWAVTFPTMLQMRIETLERYGQNEVLARTIADPAQRAARLRELAEGWARQFDPNSMVALRKAAVKFDAGRDLTKVRAKVLYVLSRTDKLFPPSIAPGVMDQLTRAGVDAKYFEIDTELGHSASGPEWAKWGPTLKDFVAGLER